MQETLRAHRNHCVGSGTLPEITVCEISLSGHPQMQVKALPCKEATCEHDPPSSLGQS